MPGYTPFSLRDDKALRHELIAAMRGRGVSISLGEGCIVRPGRDIHDLAGDLDIFQELGAERINTVSVDPDLSRSLDQFGELAEMSAARGMESSRSGDDRLHSAMRCTAEAHEPQLHG